MAVEPTNNHRAVAIPTAPAGWEEIKPGTWYRGLDAMERLLYFYEHIDPNLAQWNVAIGIKLPAGVQYSVEEVKTAWMSLRMENPVIACTIEDHGRGIQYQVPTENELVEWAEETVHIDTSGRTAREMTTYGKLPKSSTLHFFPHLRELSIHARHELLDGVGLLLCGNKFLKQLRVGSTSKHTIGEEIALLPSPTVDILGGNESLSPQMIEKAKRIAENYCDPNAIGLKTRSGGIQNVVPTLPEGLVEHQFTESDSAAILKACRANKITLTTAIWAAQAKTALKHGGGTSGNLATFVPVNLRSQVQTSATSTEINNTINLAFSHLPVDENSDFIEWAKGAQNDLSFWRNGKESMGVFRSVCEALEEKVNKDSKTGVTYPARFFLTNVGISDNYIADPVEDVWLNIMVATPSSGGLIVLTTKGRIRMTACYNRAFFDEGQIESYMEMVVSYLEKGLGLKFSDGDSLRPSIESKESISTSQRQQATTQAFPAPQQ
ncbi:hypothetical protein TWF481_010330 [Arthrobotrys musiformis]|uniref:Phthiocerol/phthiodiolone dimycocerosyl transferase C-terminal domain-containing protein n=1 Tax=Arthrobotrys musiformis TaxID=47236 RepID=A0AAV9W2U6_9PEZI